MNRSKTVAPSDFVEIQSLFQRGQQRSRRAIHAAMLETYLEIGAILGRKFREEGWASADLQNLSEWLIRRTDAGPTFTASNLEYMLHFHEAWSHHPELHPLLPELSWSSHQVLLNECKSEEERRRFLAEAAKKGWTRQELESRVQLQRPSSGG